MALGTLCILIEHVLAFNWAFAGLLNWAQQRLNPGKEKPMPPQLATYNSYDDLVKYVKGYLDEVKAKTGMICNILRVGSCSSS